MRASKESCETARKLVNYLGDRLALATDDGVLDGKDLQAVDCVLNFLNAAKRKLPTEAAFDRDAKRKKVATRG